MQCGYDDKGNSVPKILLLMQQRLYSQDGLKVILNCHFFLNFSSLLPETPFQFEPRKLL
jgi:hypothetical protein